MSRFLRMTTRTTAAALLVLALSSAGGTALAATRGEVPEDPSTGQALIPQAPDNWMPGSAAVAPANWMPVVAPDDGTPSVIPANWMPLMAPDNWMPSVVPVNWMPAFAPVTADAAPLAELAA